MQHFRDYLQDTTEQSFDMAVIVDSKGEKVGSIIARYTDAEIGWDIEVAALLNFCGLDWSQTESNCTYGHMDALNDLLGGRFVTMLTRNGDAITKRARGEGTRATGSFTGIHGNVDALVHGGETYRVYWV